MESDGGLYLLSDERASFFPNNPVWETFAGNRFIFKNIPDQKWKLGDKKGLTDGSYFCISKHILIIFTIASCICSESKRVEREVSDYDNQNNQNS